jgi:hypothetical protein
MKENIKKKSKPKIWMTVIITTLLICGTAQQSSAINLNPTQLLGNLKSGVDSLRKGADNLINQLKNDSTISQILGGLNQVTSIFLPEIQKFTGLSTEDLNKAKGILNILAPSEAKKAIEEQKAKAKTNSTITNSDHTVALSGSQSTSNNVLSKEAQEADKKVLDEISDLVKGAQDLSESTSDSANSAQEANSSQDVLKILASQQSNQAAINATQVRLAALQNANLQSIKTQLAIANQANASFERRQQGDNQQKSLREQEKNLLTIQNIIRNYRIN